MITFKSTGDFSKTYRFLKKKRPEKIEKILTRYAKEGLVALIDATPKRTGLTSQSWSYKIESIDGNWRLSYYNDNLNHGVSIVYMLVYGHATRGGTYVEGYDFITPAIQSVLDKIVERAWEEVTSDE